MSITAERKAELIKKFARTEGDTGSPEVQVAILTERINNLPDHFKDTKGYDHYATAGEVFKAVGVEAAAWTYCDVQTWGTPEMILEKLRARREMLGDYELNLIAYYGGMPVEVAEQSLRLFAEEVLPEVKRW